MKRVLLLTMVLVLALGALVAPAAAVPAADLTALARHFPADTPAFFVMRTDDTYIDELDALVDTLREALPPGALPAFSLRDALDEGIMETFGDDATFDNTIRAWLGDTVAFGIVSLEDAMSGRDDDMPVLLALEITDREEAAAFVEQTYSDIGVDVDSSERGGYTLIVPETPTNAFFAVGDDVMFLATERDLLPLNSDFRSLADNSDFADSIAALPASDYHMVLALNLEDVVSQSYAMMQAQAGMMGPAGQMFTGMQALYEDYPRQTVGVTILDDRSLTLDIAQGAFDYGALDVPFLDNLGPLLSTAAVDFDFAQYVPADAPFALQSTGFGHTVRYGIDTLAWLAELGIQQSMMSNRMDDDMPAMFEEMDANDVRAFIDLSFAGMTGLNLNDDVLPLLNGNAVAFGRVLPSDATDFMLDGALVFEVTDAAAMQALMTQLVEALVRYEADFSYEDGILVLPGVVRGMMPSRYQQELDDEATFDFLIGLNDDVFVLGTREAVEFALDGDGASLADDPAFANAQRHFLEGSQQVGYLGFGPIHTLVEQVAAAMDEGDEEATGTLVVLDALSSASYSALFNDDGVSVGRLVLTLAD